MNDRIVEIVARAIFDCPDPMPEEIARVALSALAKAGMVVVPKEPTWEMQVVGRDAILAEDDELDLSTDDARAAYRAMLSAYKPEPDEQVQR